MFVVAAAHHELQPGEVEGQGEVGVDVAAEHRRADGVGLGPPTERHQRQGELTRRERRVGAT